MEKRKIIDIPFWTWVPKVSLGPFHIGKSIKDYLKQYNLCDEDEFNAKEYPGLKLDGFQDMPERYIIPTYDSSFVIFTKNGIIDEFRIETYLYYNGQDIIMSPIAKAMEIIGRKSYDDTSREEIIDEKQDVYYYYDLGLSLWTLDNVVVTAFCDDGTGWE